MLLSLPVVFDIVKDRILFKLVNRADNELLLRYVPYVPFLDLAAVFFIKSDMDDEELFVTNVYKRCWKKSTTKLLELAKINIARAYPPEIYMLQDFIYRMIFGVAKQALPLLHQLKKDDFYLLTNKDWHYGGVYLMFDDFMKAIYQKLDTPYYIIPIDIHMLAIIPKNMKQQESLKEIMNKLNHRFNKTGDFLSYNYYLVNEDGICEVIQ